jgi:hypothetical protein
MRGIGDRTLAELLNLSSNLPLDKQGLLAKTPRQILTLGTRAVRRLNNQMQAKSQCIDLVLAGKEVPANVTNCKHHQGNRKEWLYRPVGAESQPYIYLPARLMP